VNEAGIALARARDRISTPDRWTKGWFSRDKFGSFVYPFSDDAVRFCAIGAIQNAVGPVGTEGRQQVINTVFGAIYDALEKIDPDCAGLAEYNDTHNHEQVLALFDAAIELLETG